ncbi:MAG: hypothetical protein ACI3XQ_00260 [Eubacteriales bacterium]
MFGRKNDIARGQKEVQKKEPLSAAERRERVVLIAAIAISSIVVFAVYRLLLNYYYFEYVLMAYIGVSAVCILSYVIYNRGFSRSGITVDMLPDSWSEEKKTDFVEDARRRLRKSRPLLVAVLAFVITFAFDVLELYVFPFLKSLFI